MPLSRDWVEDDVKGLTGESYHLAKLILIVCKASYQYDDSLNLFKARDYPLFTRCVP